MLNDKQRELIELIVTENYSITAACKAVNIHRRSYYDWKQGTGKTAKAFQKAYDEALELKVKESRQRVRNNVNSLLDSLDEITKKSRNDNARVAAVSKLIQYAELEKQELNVNINKDDNKNDLLEMWKNKQQDNEEEK